MICFMQKSFVRINHEVKSGGSVVVHVVAELESPAPAPAQVDAVTTATFAKNMYLPIMPACAPLRQKKD